MEGTEMATGALVEVTKVSSEEESGRILVGLDGNRMETLALPPHSVFFWAGSICGGPHLHDH